MFTEPVQDALNAQINSELYSAYLYLSMSCTAETSGMIGSAHWLTIQAREELAHGVIFIRYLLNRGGILTLTEIEKPPYSWDSMYAVFEAAAIHERSISQRIHRLASLAEEHHDYPTVSLLKWFIDEQVEEEASLSRILLQMKRFPDDSPASFLLDRELGTRVYVTPDLLLQAENANPPLAAV